MREKSTGAVLAIGDSMNNPDVAYATGLSLPDPVVVLRTGGSVYVVVPQMELRRAERAARWPGGKRVILTPAALGIRRKRGGDRLTRWAVALLRHAGERAVTVSRSFPYGVARGLERRGVRVRLGGGTAFPERALKGADELRKIRECQQAAVIAMRGAVAMIAGAAVGPWGRLRCGGAALTSELVGDAIRQVLLAHRCLCRDVIVACGKHSADPHEHGAGPLRAGEPIVMDIFPQHLEHGYWGDLTRTVVRGKAPARLRRMYQAVRAAQAAALAAIRPGVKCATVHERAAAEMKRRGFATVMEGAEASGFIHGTGHGVGLSIHEEPALADGVDGRLRAGHVVTVEPGLYYPGFGGVRIEDTVVVTPGGWRYLAPCEKRLEV